MSVHGLKRIVVRIPPDEVCSHCGAATKGEEKTRFGFLLSDNTGDGSAKVRFLGPRGFSDEEVPKEQILGIVGGTFISSVPHRPDFCERVAFDIRWGWKRREERYGWIARKGWVVEVDQSGRVVLAAGEEIIERWVEQLFLMPLGEGFREISDEEVEEKLDAPFQRENVEGVRANKRGGTREQEHRIDLAEATRRADRLRELFGKSQTPDNSGQQGETDG